jgi:sugar phosphate isomerase/epimerase
MKFVFDQPALPGSSFAEQVGHAAAAHADAVQIAWLRVAEAQRFNDRTLAKAMVSQAGGAGIDITGVTVHCLADEVSFLGDASERTKAAETLARAMAFASLVDAPTVVLPLIGRNRIETDDDMKRAAEAVWTGSDLATRFNVRLALRCGLSGSKIVHLLDDSQAAGAVEICLDLADAAVRGLDPGTIIRTLGNSTLSQVWVRDVVRTFGQRPDYRIRLGRGLVDFASVRHALSASEFTGLVVVDTPPGDPDGQIAAMNMADAQQLLAISVVRETTTSSA